MPFQQTHHGMLVKTCRWPPVAKKKMVLQLIIVAGLLSSLTLTQSVPSSRIHETLPGTQCVQNITFLHLIPCWRALDMDIDGIHRRSAALDKLNSCDLLARAAVELAIERVNENQNEIFGYGSRDRYVRTVPLFPEINDTTLQRITEIFRFVKSNEFFGVIGPNDTAEAAFWAPIFQRSNLMTLSYDITSPEPDKTSNTFYRTLPSDRAANIGRLNLIARFKWFRIATISSQERYYAQIGEHFISLYNKSNRILWSTSFTKSPDSALQEVYSRDINIIFGFFDSQTARKVLCRAKSLFTDLVSADHAWILPAYYSPNWWKLPAGMESECSDEDLRTVLESMIFVDTVKYPPVDLSLDGFHSQLLPKARDLFPSLTEEDLKPYLLHSRAASAYDAVTLLARSVGVAFDQAGGGKCNNISVTQRAFEKIFLVCEYCRLNSGCFLNETETGKCQDLCGSEYTPNATQFTREHYYHNSGLRSYHLLNYYGQILFSQFIDGEDCAVELLWPGDHEAVNGIVHTEENLDRVSCPLQLNLSRTLRNFTRRSNTDCPLTFQWRGSPDPPRSRHRLVYNTPLYQMVIVGVVTGIGSILATTFLVFNIVWRKSKAIKATSPWMNVILIAGIILRFPVPLMDGLVQSAASTKYAKVTDPICYFRDLNEYLGFAIFVSVLVMKNWRLYRIFNNQGMKYIGEGLTDRWLFLGTFLWCLPVICALIVRFSISLRLEIQQPLNERLQLEEFGLCVSVTTGTKGILDIYIAIILSSILFGLSFLTSLIHSPVAFHREAVHSLRAITVTMLPISSLYIVLSFLVIHVKLKNLEPILWIRFMADVCLPILIMLILFGSSTYMVVKKYYVKLKKGKHSHELTNRYHQLLKEKEDLKIQLSKINQMKMNFLAEQQEHLQASSGLRDKGASEAEKVGTVHGFMEKTGTVMFVDSLPVTADSNRQAESKSPQHMETLLISELQALEVDESIRTLYTIVSTPDSSKESMSRHPVPLSDSNNYSQS